MGKLNGLLPQYMTKLEHLLSHAGLMAETNKRIWCECASTVVKIENILVKEKNGKCAYKIMHNKIPRYIEDLRIFGEKAIIRDNGNKIKGKLSHRGSEALFVGYSENHTS